jgi:predicted RNA-binding Zn ribbon-like protein
MAVDLVNTRRDGQDQLVSRFDLREFLIAQGEPEPIELADTDLISVLVLRSRLRAVFAAETETEAAGLLNELLAESAAVPYLSDHGGVGWHLHMSRPDASWSDSLAAQTATALAQLIGAGGFNRMRTCAAEDCKQVFIEQSRNHSQRFCGQTCATRTRVTAYRARRTDRDDISFPW